MGEEAGLGEVLGGLASLPMLGGEGGMEQRGSTRVVEGCEGKGCPAPHGDAVGGCEKYSVEASRVSGSAKRCGG